MNSPFAPVRTSMISTASQLPWTPIETPYATMHSGTAYTAVATRQNFSRPESNMMNVAPVVQPPPPPPPAQTPAQRWPDSVRHYVQRSFAEGNSIAGIGRQEMEAKLKELITHAGTSNTLYSIDWYTHPLPQELIQAERMSFSPMPVNVTSSQMAHLSFRDTNILSNGVSPSKKRKSNEYEKADDSDMTSGSVPPWRSKTNNAGNKNGHRADKRRRQDSPTKSDTGFDVQNEQRKRRFEAMGAQPAPYVSLEAGSSALDPNAGPVVGTCQRLEKGYLRLTAPPNPATVRPLAVLEKTLDLLKKKWKDENNYGYICDQFKSLRQDLTVQHIKSDFTVKVYEIHARIALEKGDMGEYNQCQVQLRSLYAKNLGGHPAEFKAYRILYFLFTCSRMDMNDALADLTPADKSTEPIKHALETRRALALGNYHRFFLLYQETPNMGAYLMDMFVGRERVAAMTNMAKAYKPNLKLRFVTEELGFESDEHAARFICEQGGQDFLEEKEGEVRLLTGANCVAVFETARQKAFKKVDIKGQI